VEIVTRTPNTLIVPTDAQTLKACRKNDLPCVLVDAADAPQIKEWGEIGFVKYYTMALLSGLGITFIMSEMDVQIYKDPWPYHSEEDAEQYRKGWCAGLRNPSLNARAENAVIQITAHYNHPRVNIGYVYVRWATETMRFLAQLFGYFLAKCPDRDLGWHRRNGAFVDDGLPDQNIFDALLRNHDHKRPRYGDIPWDLVPRLAWKLLDFNVFALNGGKTDHKMELVTLHYPGDTRQVACWKTGLCELMSRAQSDPAALHFECSMRVQRACQWPRCAEPGFEKNDCVSPVCRPQCIARGDGIKTLSLQAAVKEECLAVPIRCSLQKWRRHQHYTNRTE